MQFNSIEYMYLIEDKSLSEPDVIEYMKENSTAVLECPFKGVNNISWFTRKETNNKSLIALASNTQVKPGYENVKIVGNHTNGEYNIELQRLTKADENNYQCVTSIHGVVDVYSISLRLSSKCDTMLWLKISPLFKSVYMCILNTVSPTEKDRYFPFVA